MADFVIERLGRAHQRADFGCGKAPLDDFLRSRVNQYERRRLGRTYVAVRPGEKRVWGYYTLAAGSVAVEHLPPGAAKKLPKHPVPVVVLARLAVDRAVQGKGLSGLLLSDAPRRCLSLEEQLRIHAVVLDALDDQAKAFYLKFGFVPLLDDERHLFLPLATVAAALGGSEQDAP
jgi:GNAT superfamily N-acetyltransferase